MKIVIIDNYDSFVYNLSHAIKELGAEVTVKRNDQFRLEELEEFDKILLSPGPGVPEEAGLLLDVIRRYAGKKPILGVCLGEQAIGEVYGGKLTNLDEVFHGIQSSVTLTATTFFHRVHLKHIFTHTSASPAAVCSYRYYSFAAAALSSTHLQYHFRISKITYSAGLRRFELHITNGGSPPCGELPFSSILLFLTHSVFL